RRWFAHRPSWAPPVRPRSLYPNRTYRWTPGPPPSDNSRGLPTLAGERLPMAAEHLLIFGASARAAAFSALRVGLRRWCADLFADLDLQARCPAMRLPGRYPHAFLDLAATDLPGPLMYTGGLENWPALVG